MERTASIQHQNARFRISKNMWQGCLEHGSEEFGTSSSLDFLCKYLDLSVCTPECTFVAH